MAQQPSNVSEVTLQIPPSAEMTQPSEGVITTPPPAKMAQPTDTSMNMPPPAKMAQPTVSMSMLESGGIPPTTAASPMETAKWWKRVYWGIASITNFTILAASACLLYFYYTNSCMNTYSKYMFLLLLVVELFSRGLTIYRLQVEPEVQLTFVQFMCVLLFKKEYYLAFGTHQLNSEQIRKLSNASDYTAFLYTAFFVWALYTNYGNSDQGMYDSAACENPPWMLNVGIKVVTLIIFVCTLLLVFRLVARFINTCSSGKLFDQPPNSE